jgi:diguanylate cyclase (GGDEF)-like protein/PAS domain S-box-containing protein
MRDGAEHSVDAGRAGLAELDHIDRELVEAENLRLMTRNLPVALVFTLVVALSLCVVMWPVVDHVNLLLWGFLIFLLTLVRYVGIARFNKVSPSPELLRSWRLWFLGGILASGMAWGLAGLLLYPVDDPLRQSFLVLMMIGLCAGGMTVHASMASATWLFTLPTLLPMIARQLTDGSAMGTALGITGTLFIVVLLVTAKRIGTALSASQELRLQLEKRNEALVESRQKLALHVERTPLAVIEWDREMRVTSWNEAAERIFGFHRDEAMGHQVLKHLLPLEERSNVDSIWRDMCEPRLEGQRNMLINVTRDGRDIWCDWINTPLVTAGGELVGVASLVMDVSEQIESEAAMRTSEAKYRALVEQSLAGVYMVSGERFIYVNPMFAEIFGYTAEEVINHCTVADLVHPEDLPQVKENLRQRYEREVPSTNYQFRALRKDGEQIIVEVFGSGVEIDGKRLVLGTLLDITENQKAHEHIKHLANHDALTDLPNRHHIEQRANRLIAEALKSDSRLTCLYIDLDRFKNVNDTLGHEFGDRLLKEAAKRMLRCLRGQDVLARMGGDEFTVLLPGADHEVAARVAQRLIREMHDPFSIDSKLIRVGASIGAAELSGPDDDFNTLWKQADIAMYRAKRRRGTFAFFEASQELELSKRVRIERDLEPGLAAGEFSLNFQPRIDMRTGLSDSVEALVRWEHPEMGPVSPVFFIPVAEESGQIHRLGNWIFDQACAQVAAWRRSGMSMRIAINLSVVELQASDIVERITRVLEKRGIAGEWIEIEITESAAMLNPEHSIDVITAFRDRGIEISIDDFGTGYSSLSYLKRIPANYLKIDRSFLQNITGPESNDSVDSDIIRAIVALGHSLGMEIIAEGVEMPGQQEFLSGHGCFLAQGYHYCKPLPVSDLERWLERGAQQPSPLPVSTN